MIHEGAEQVCSTIAEAKAEFNASMVPGAVGPVGGHLVRTYVEPDKFSEVATNLSLVFQLFHKMFWKGHLHRELLLRVAIRRLFADGCLSSGCLYETVSCSNFAMLLTVQQLSSQVFNWATCKSCYA